MSKIDGEEGVYKRISYLIDYTPTKNKQFPKNKTNIIIDFCIGFIFCKECKEKKPLVEGSYLANKKTIKEFQTIHRGCYREHEEEIEEDKGDLL